MPYLLLPCLCFLLFLSCSPFFSLFLHRAPLLSSLSNFTCFSQYSTIPPSTNRKLDRRVTAKIKPHANSKRNYRAPNHPQDRSALERTRKENEWERKKTARFWLSPALFFRPPRVTIFLLIFSLRRRWDFTTILQTTVFTCNLLRSSHPRRTSALYHFLPLSSSIPFRLFYSETANMPGWFFYRII